MSSLPSVTQPSTASDNYDAIMNMLCEIKESNADLARRLDKVERRSSTPINPRSHSHGHPVSPQLGSSNLPQQSDIPNHPRDPFIMPRMGQPHLHSHPPLTRDFVQTQVSRDIQHQDPSVGLPSRAQEQPGHVFDRREAVVPNLHTLRTNPGISEAVNNLLASYEGQANSDLSQGKPQGKKSGRYNLHDTISMAPHLRWPNKGFHASNGKKRVVYDELSLPQWISDQLSNIYAIPDPTLSKQALLQVIFAMRDAVSLPWPAVRAAWASSMHQVEEGRGPPLLGRPHTIGHQSTERFTGSFSSHSSHNATNTT